jgi:hypothetical protein
MRHRLLAGVICYVAVSLKHAPNAGDTDVATTQIYIHLARKPGETVKSPLDERP